MKVHLRIYGMVQGVFFRQSAKDKADELGIVGWVRNNQDGSVEAMAGGSEGKLKEFVAWCKKGPPFAKVDDVEEDWQKQGDDFSSFEILG